MRAQHTGFTPREKRIARRRPVRPAVRGRFERGHPPGYAGTGAAEKGMALTRESIRSGAVHRLIAELGIEMRVLSEAELRASLAETLAGADLSAGVWLFGYGSLIWNPAFHFTDRLVGRVHGWHRRFCLWTHLGRGCPERPGLVLGLERGGSCQGVAFHIAPEVAEEELLIVWRREMLSGAYLPRWVTVHAAAGAVRAIAFVINPGHERYARALSDVEIAATIATAEGFLGPCADYLVNTVDHLAELGIHDRPLERLRAQVLRHAAER
jgi:glutathione-specific gamma-glutamylcyclotransferase